MRRYLAANRFGLGLRPGDVVPEDPSRWLLGQLSAFEPAPQPIASLPGRGELAAAFMEYREERAAERAARPAGAPNGAAPAAPTPQEMRQAARERRRRQMESGVPAEPMTGMAAENEALPMDRPGQQGGRRPLRGLYLNAVHARTLVALTSATPFVERWVHFWSNHFAVSADKVSVVPFVGDYEFSAIRPHVLGRFSSLLVAAVTHPAMLLFLDQAQSVGPDSPAAQRMANRRPDRTLGLNENLAREILELHTLGVRSGYSQADVTSLAQAMTGITIAGLGRGPAQRLIGNGAAAGDSVFVDALHQPGERTVLGRRYNQRGAGQAEAILADLSVHPATARHIATKLARHFVADQPPATLIARLEADFLRTNGDLASLARTLISAPEAAQTAQPKFKSPWDWSISALRGLGTTRLPNPQGTAAMFQQLGQSVWRPGSPAGFSDMASDWAGPQALADRVDLADRLGARAGPSLDARALAPQLLVDALSPEISTAISRADSPAQGLALLLVSPPFMRR